MRYAMIVGLLILALFSCKNEGFHANEKNVNGDKNLPNVLWLVTEDLSPDFFSMYGDSSVSTPNLDALAAEGTIYDNAYATVPVCAPARSSIITGMYPTTIGTHNMRTFNASNQKNEESIGIPSYSPILPEGVKGYTEYLRMAGYYCTNNAKKDYNFKTPPSLWDESSSNAHWRNRPENSSPFFAVFNYNGTHESQIWGNKDKEIFVAPSKLIVPPFFPDNDSVRHDLAVNYSNIKRMDDWIGDLVGQLKEDGLYDNTIIFFYGDHGGPFPRYKRSLYETGTKVPFIIKMQKGSKVSPRESRMISFIDLAPTMLSLAGIVPKPEMQGEAFLGAFAKKQHRNYLFTTSDRFDEVYDRVRAVRSDRYKYIRNYHPEQPYALPVAYREQMTIMKELRKESAKGTLISGAKQFMQATKPAEELYDLEKDPKELQNLINEKSLAGTLATLRQKLDAWILETKDLGGVPEKELMDKWITEGNSKNIKLMASENNGKLTLSTDVIGATILVKAKTSESWKIYLGAVGKKEVSSSKACKVGYGESEELYF